MAVKLRTSTEYDLKNLTQLQWVAGKTFCQKQTMLKRGFSVSWGILFTSLGVLIAFGYDSIPIALVCCIAGVFLLARGIFFYPLTAWITSQAMGETKRGNDYLFEPSEIVALRGTQSARYHYSHCVQLLETNEMLYVIMKNGQGLMLDKGNVQGGTAGELRAWLESKCSRKAEWVGHKR